MSTDVKRNLFPLFHDKPEETEFEKLLFIQKSKYNFDSNNVQNSKRKKIKIAHTEESEKDEDSLDEKLNYIFEKDNNIKNKMRKSKTSGSCKCNKTNCSNNYCNCLKNGFKCDILCSCTDCGNKDNSLDKLLNKKLKR
jgi:hypothetical protein